MESYLSGKFEINPIENHQGFILFESGTIQLHTTFMHHCLTIIITQIEEPCNNLIKESQECKPRENAIVEFHEYQIPVAQLV